MLGHADGGIAGDVRHGDVVALHIIEIDVVDAGRSDADQFQVLRAGQGAAAHAHLVADDNIRLPHTLRAFLLRCFFPILSLLQNGKSRTDPCPFPVTLPSRITSLMLVPPFADDDSALSGKAVPPVCFERRHCLKYFYLRYLRTADSEIWSCRYAMLPGLIPWYLHVFADNLPHQLLFLGRQHSGKPALGRGGLADALPDFRNPRFFSGSANSSFRSLADSLPAVCGFAFAAPVPACAMVSACTGCRSVCCTVSSTALCFVAANSFSR